MVKKILSSKQELSKKLTVNEKKLLAQVLKEKALAVKKKADHFNRESKKQFLVAVIAAFSFLMALSWREVILEYVNLLESFSPIQGQLMSAMIVTIISVLGILIANKYLGEKEEK